MVVVIYIVQNAVTPALPPAAAVVLPLQVINSWPSIWALGKIRYDIIPFVLQIPVASQKLPGPVSNVNLIKVQRRLHLILGFLAAWERPLVLSGGQYIPGPTSGFYNFLRSGDPIIDGLSDLQ